MPDRFRHGLLHVFDDAGILLDADLSGGSITARLRDGPRDRPLALERALTIAGIAALAAVAIVFIVSQVWNLPTPGDISNALRTQDFDAYTLSLGHMGDLTLRSFAYLRPPLVMAGIAFLALAISAIRLRGSESVRWSCGFDGAVPQRRPRSDDHLRSVPQFETTGGSTIASHRMAV